MCSDSIDSIKYDGRNVTIATQNYQHKENEQTQRKDIDATQINKPNTKIQTQRKNIDTTHINKRNAKIQTQRKNIDTTHNNKPNTKRSTQTKNIVKLCLHEYALHKLVVCFDYDGRNVTNAT